MINNIPALGTFYQGSAAVKLSAKDEVHQFIKTASDSEHKAQALAQQFAMGAEGVSIHQVMIAAQKSLIAIKASTEITKRCLNAYQEIWNMPI